MQHTNKTKLKMTLIYFKSIIIKMAKFAYHLFDSTGFLYKACAAVILYFAGIHSFLGVILALVLIDVATGLIAALKKGERFSSRKLRKGLLEKMLLYLCLLITVFLADGLLLKTMGLGSYYLTFCITFLISMYELASIAENLYSIRPDIPFLGGLVGIFKTMGESALNSMKKRSEEIADQLTDIKGRIKVEGEVTISMSGETS